MGSRTKIKILALILSSWGTYVCEAVCRSDEFFCDGIRCLPRTWVCDGSPDCSDGSDELPSSCPEIPGGGLVRECRTLEFKCGNGNCIPDRWKCDGQDDCRDNTDENLPECTECANNEFRCLSDHQCIANNFLCNGVSDCNDGSDESECGETEAPLPSHMFECNNKRRIPKGWLCDGEDDCKDGTDEESCTTESITSTAAPLCRENEYQCGMYCIMRSWLCDGNKDCENGEDEEGCPPECADNEFMCTDGSCIEDRQKCDGQANCADGSDENECPESTPTPATPSCNSTSHFTCQRSGRCIPNTKLCDGNDDCGDDSDEKQEGCINECNDRSNGGCSQICIDTKDSYRCECRKGYRLVRGVDCEDINECLEQTGACSQQCTNTIGGFHCSCVPGYRRDPRNFTRCKADTGEPYLLFSHSYDIRRLRLRDGELTAVVNNTRLTTALDYQFSSHQIVWCNNKDNRIMRADMTNPEPAEILVENENLVADGLAVDWIHGNIYFTNTGSNEIKMLSWDGTWTKTIANEELGQPRAIVANPIDGFLYWTDWGSPAKIERSGLDGTDRKAIVSAPVVHWPNSITVDYASKKLYWCDGFFNKIMMSDLDGRYVETILYSPRVLRHPFSVSVFEDRMYWVDWSQVALFSADKFTGQDIKHLSAGHLLESPRVVHVLHPYRQPSAKNVCSSHSCSHFCVRSPSATPVCVCPDLHVLDSSGSVCVLDTGDRPTIPQIDLTTLPPNPIPTLPPAQTQPPNLLVSNTLAPSTENGAKSPQPVIIVGVILGATTLAVVLIGIVIARYRMRTFKSIPHTLFPNPVYRKTTDPDTEGGGYVYSDQLFFSTAPPEYQEENNSCFVDDDEVPLAQKN